MSGSGSTKVRRSKPKRLLRLVLSTLDPRAWAHFVKVMNFYNYSHVSELRKVTRGRGVTISPTANFANGQNIVLGDRCNIGVGCYIWAGPGSGRIVMADCVLLAPQVMMSAANYRYNDGSPVTDQAMREADIVIGRDVWIGFAAVILAGAEIGEGSVIGAGAVVRGHVPPWSIVAGNPAAIVGQRKMAGGASSP